MTTTMKTMNSLRPFVSNDVNGLITGYINQLDLEKKIELYGGLVELFKDEQDSLEAYNLAASHGHIELVKYLVKLSKRRKVWYHYELGAGMINASRAGQFPMVKYLIEQGAGEYNTSIALAAMYGHTDLVKYLVAVSDENIDWDDAMKCAATGGYIHLVEYFIEQGAEDFDEAMTGAATRGHTGLVKYFIHLGATNFNEGIEIAASCITLVLVQYFIEQGADNLDEAMRSATMLRYTDIVEYFTSIGVAPYIPPGL